MPLASASSLYDWELFHTNFDKMLSMNSGTILAQPAIPPTAALQGSIRSCVCWAWMYHNEVVPTDYGFPGRTEILFLDATLPATQATAFDKDLLLQCPNFSYLM